MIDIHSMIRYNSNKSKQKVVLSLFDLFELYILMFPLLN